MNWFKENKFLAGLLVFVLLGAAALGYLAFAAKTRADESLQNYQQTSSSLKSLKSSPIYPNSQNLAKLEAQRAQHQEHVEELTGTLVGMVPPLEPISPEQFQDRLRETVTAFVKDAATGNMVLPKAFYMGFDQYQSTPPRAEAVPYLTRSLKVVDFILRELLNARVSDLRSLDREPIPEEAKGGGGGGSGPAKGGKAGAPAAQEPMKKRTFQIVFYGEQISTQKILNAFTAEKKWFLIPRFVRVENEKPKGPLKEDPAAQPTGDPVPAPAPAPGVPLPPGVPPPPTAPAAKAFQFIVGEEKVETTMLLEAVIFTQADAGTATPKKENK